jgi:DnaK suppressor protein
MNQRNRSEASRSSKGERTARKEAIESLREVLLRRREALRKALAGDLSLLKELAEQSMGDVVDFALDCSQDEITSQLAEVESRELANIEVALNRMRAGSYGECENCNNPIPMARLMALPYATSCIECQREIERSGGLGNTPRQWGNVLDTGSSDKERTIVDLEMDVS